MSGTLVCAGPIGSGVTFTRLTVRGETPRLLVGE